MSEPRSAERVPGRRPGRHQLSNQLLHSLAGRRGTESELLATVIRNITGLPVDVPTVTYSTNQVDNREGDCYGVVMRRIIGTWLRRRCIVCGDTKPRFTGHCDRCWDWVGD
jgi:hypothetical protein